MEILLGEIRAEVSEEVVFKNLGESEIVLFLGSPGQKEFGQRIKGMVFQSSLAL